MAENSKQIRAHCNSCLGERNHIELHNEKSDWAELYEPGITISGGETYQMLKCCGCDSVKLRHRHWMSEQSDEHGRPYVSESYYPPASSRSEPIWLSDLEFPFDDGGHHFIAQLLKEIYSATHNNSRRLAVMGIRSLLEHIMISQSGDQHSFSKNLDKFQSDGFLSAQSRQLIEPILEAGHATMHREFQPSSEDVQTALGIAESLVESIYVHSKQALKLQNRVPRRKVKTAPNI